eukprot:c19565_g1_i2.p1 GENE.c19565_g1_i2~~c19565_g1_i2.p1  ORF type:complete len:135 (-),score=24.77 c19565_g1_i2:179-583(-)
MAVQFSVYEFLQANIDPNGVNDSVKNASFGGAAGAIGKFTTMPADVVKRQQQARMFLDPENKHVNRQVVAQTLETYQLSEHRAKTTMTEIARDIWRRQGILGFFRGTSVATIKSGLNAGITFAVFEWLSKNASW